MKRALIIGASGVIGRALADHLQACGVHTLRSALNPPAEPDAVRLPDLADASALRRFALPEADTVLYCAGVASYAACRENPARAAAVNVTAAASLCRRCAEAGARFLYLSSSSVFDGSRPFMPADAPPCPMTEYGRQKARAEAALLRHEHTAVIVRLTKVFGPGSILETWERALRNGELIRPFSDVTCAPLPLPNITELLTLIADAGETGIWQISGPRDIPYAQVALELAERLDVDPGLVRPWTVGDSGAALEHVPAFTSLDTARLDACLRGRHSGARHV
jgi:dTDP-4-dehydrorhamnose reductase